MNKNIFHVFPPEAVLPYAPEVRLAHDYPVGPASRCLRKERIGDHALHYFASGKGEYHLNGHCRPIEPGEVFLVRPGQGYEFHLAPESETRMFNLHFDLEDDPRFASAFPCPDDAAPGKMVLPPEWADFLTLKRPQYYETLFQELLNGSSKLQRRGKMLEILALLAEESQGDSPPVAKAALRAQEILRGELSGQWTLAELAKKLGMSRSHLAAIFRRQTGQSVGEFRRRARIEHARYLLSSSNAPLKAVAEECGFADIHHFSRIFKDKTGITPGKFREEYQFSDD